MTLELQDTDSADISFEVLDTDDDMALDDGAEIADGYTVRIDADEDSTAERAKVLTFTLPRKSKKTGKPLNFFTLKGAAPGRSAACTLEVVKKETDGPLLVQTHERSGKIRIRRVHINEKGPTVIKITSFPTSKSARAKIIVGLDTKSGTTKAKVKVF